MSGWKAKRFWQAATAEACEGGFTVRLDGRPVRTPGKKPLVVPTLALAQAMADEWQAQQGAVRPETMPLTRFANSAIEKVAPQRAEVVAYLADYGGTDLLCYRATDPEELAARQAAAWDPLLDWAASTFGAPLAVTRGVMPVAQPSGSLARLTAAVDRHDAFRLSGFHDFVGVTGSLVLALALAEGRLTPDQALDLARIDEDWQIALWGQDEEAARTAAARRAALHDAARFFGLAG